MESIRLGRTNLLVTRTAFGVLPLQRTPMEEAVRVLRRAYDAGITFYDTARAYSDSEEKIGQALSGVREKIVIATKSGAATKAGILSDLQVSLHNLRTDYVDILQLHNSVVLPNLADADSAYAALLEAREKGMVRYIGMTSHSLSNAIAAAESGLFDTVQFPLSYLSSAKDLSLIDVCREHNIGLIAMKALAGGLITNARPAFAFLRQYANVVPIWGFQRMTELEEVVDFDANPPAPDDEMWAIITRDRTELAGDFCRACGYCLPCPAEIPIPMAARMPLLLRRMPFQQFMTESWQSAMARINDCQHCGHCTDHCPYGLDTPALLRKALRDYEAFYQEYHR